MRSTRQQKGPMLDNSLERMFIARAPNPHVECNSMEYLIGEGVVLDHLEQFEE
jgi:hypothetical protein